MEDLAWKVYIIETENGKLYTGITNNLEKRFELHQTQKGARFFRFSRPEKILYLEFYKNRSDASKRESQIKKLSRLKKRELIAAQEALEEKRHF